ERKYGHANEVDEHRADNREHREKCVAAGPVACRERESKEQARDQADEDAGGQRHARIVALRSAEALCSRSAVTAALEKTALTKASAASVGQVSRAARSVVAQRDERIDAGRARRRHQHRQQRVDAARQPTGHASTPSRRATARPARAGPPSARRSLSAAASNSASTGRRVPASDRRGATADILWSRGGRA